MQILLSNSFSFRGRTRQEDRPIWTAILEAVSQLPPFRLDASLDLPLYRQVAGEIQQLIDRGVLRPGDKLPPTRELAGQLGLNRTTVSAAYSVLERSGSIDGRVGRGSFVAGSQSEVPDNAGPELGSTISFASSRPSAHEFPVDGFRRLAKEVIDGADVGELLQLGSAFGYGPLRRFLVREALQLGHAKSGDDLLITNGCQQALDLIAREFAGPGTSIVLEDPVYHGMLRTFARSGAELFGVPVDHDGIDPASLEDMLERHKPAIVAVTPSFQNPTGATLPFERRKRIAELAGRFGCLLIEVDVYTGLRYSGTPLPAVRTFASGPTLLLGSYSKVSFPGLRVGWVLGPRDLIARLAEAKEISDLHSDHLSQAVLLRFAESGELDRHLRRSQLSGAARLEAVLSACEHYLPPGARWTRPEGGMNLWVEFPPPIDAEMLLRAAEARGVTFLTGRHFSTRNAHRRALRLSFGGLKPEQITSGVEILGEAAREQLIAPAYAREELAAALV